MKKTLLLLITLITVFLLFSCKPSSANGGNTGGVLFSESIAPTLVYNQDNFNTELFDVLYEGINEIIVAPLWSRTMTQSPPSVKL